MQPGLARYRFREIENPKAKQTIKKLELVITESTMENKRNCLLEYISWLPLPSPFFLENCYEPSFV